MLRNGSLMVAGQAYEGNCWTKYNALYRDAWWSPISYAYGTNESWDTLGQQGGDDNIYDFTQLVDGNIVFVGKKSSTAGLGGVWAFVTDSTGKSVLWEQQVNIPRGTTDGRAPKPLAVCANPDSGFTVAGEYACNDENGAMNAFVARFVPSAPANISRTGANNKRSADVNYTISGNRIIFKSGYFASRMVKLQMFNASGKMVAEVSRKDTDAGSITLDCQRFARGVYYYKLNFGNGPVSGKLVVR